MRLLKDRDYLSVLIKEIGKARKEIIIRIFLIDPSRERVSPVLVLLRALQKAQKRGVRVAILSEGIFRRKASGQRLTQAAKRLGLAIEWDARETVLHEKTLRIDGQTLFVGSHNWTNPSLLENRELSVQLPSRIKRISGSELSVRSSQTKSFPNPAILDALAFSKQLVHDIDRARSEVLIASFDIDESSNPYDFGTRVAQALIRAKERGLVVRLLLDSSQLRIPETGEILYHLRGFKKAQELARREVEVYYDTTISLFHAKAAVIDERILYTGSQNLELRKEGTVLESTARLISRTHARQARRYLENFFQPNHLYVYGPSELVGIPLPFGFLERKGVLSRMYTAGAAKTFRFYLSLVKEAWKSGSADFVRTLPDSLKDDRRRLVGAYRVLRYEPGSWTRKSRLTLLDPGNDAPFQFPTKDFFILPDTFFDYGWLDRLRMREIFVFLIHLAQSQNSSESPYWSMRNRDIAKRFGIDSSSLAHATVELERWNLIEVIRDPKITVKDHVKKPNRYRLNEIWNPAEHALAKKKMLEELALPASLLREAEVLAAKLNEGNDLDVIRKFLLLIDRYGLAEVKKAAGITARFKHQFALRNVHHTAAILRNWSAGVFK